MTSSAEWRTALGELDALEVLTLEDVLASYTAQTKGIPTMRWVIASAMLGDVRAELATRAEMERLQDDST